MNERSDATAMTDLEARRQRMRHRFEVWLDDVMADEPPPQGIDRQIIEALEQDDTLDGTGGMSATPDDRVAIFAAVTALTQEVKLQGRTFQQLDESLRPLIDEHAEGSDTGPANPLWDVLFDLHDRLRRGLNSCQAGLQRFAEHRSPGGWRSLLRVARPAGAEAQHIIEDLQQGCSLTLQRIADALQQQGITVIECQGKPFDPHSMVATDVVEDADQPQGTVVEVFQGGFRQQDHILRLASVKVTTGVRQPVTQNDTER
jgi:hypothetical protein